MNDSVMNSKKTFHQATAFAADSMEKFQAELEFASMLCAWHPGKARGWDALMVRASAAVEQAARTGSVRGIADAVRQAEMILAPIGRLARTHTVYCVGHAHIDMNWMWPWQETVAVVNDTFGTVLKLMDEFPGFRFSQSQASVYAILEQHNPGMLAQIARRVKSGQWEVTASHWVENDKNLSGPESLCRHLLYTRAYMQKLFRLSPEDVPIDWTPDMFGFAATIPTYLARGGVKYMYLHRPGGEGVKRPPAFWWRGPDGSRVLVRNDMKQAYNGRVTPRYLLDSLQWFVDETGLPLTMAVCGVGDHGGGPTRRDILRWQDMAAWPIFPEVRFSTAREFFEALEARGAKLPVLDQELNFECAGCYTSQTLIKKANRYSENRLTDAEVAASLAWAANGHPFPGPALRESWQDTLFSQFHDILPGSGVHDTRTYTHGLFQKIMAATGMIETQALRGLASQVDTSGFAGEPAAPMPVSRLATAVGAGVGFGSAGGLASGAEQSAGAGNRPFMIFNPTAGDREEVVEATVWDNAAGDPLTPFRKRVFSVQCADGRRIPAQTIKDGNYWGHDYVTVAFPVNVPGLGYAACAVVEGGAPAVEPGVRFVGRRYHCSYMKYEREPEGLENEHIRMELDPATGGIRTLRDKRSGVDLIQPAAGAPTLEYGVEMPHGMSSWLTDHSGVLEPPRVEYVTRRAAGPYKAALEVKLAIRESAFTLTYEVRAGDPQLHLHLTGTWFQRGTKETGVPFLRLAFPLALAGARGCYEVPFGAVDRELNRGQEVPALQWAKVTGKAGGRTAGCLLVNDSKHGHSLDGHILRLTLIRSSYEPDPLPEIGEHEVHVALRPFVGPLPVQEAIRVGRAFNHALRVIGTDVHEGTLPVLAGLIQVKPETVALHCLKKAEDADGLVLILSESAGRPATARIEFSRALLGRVAEAMEVDLMERPVRRSSARVGGNAVSVKIPAHGIASVRVRLERG